MLLAVILLLLFPLVTAFSPNNFDPTGQVITFYLSSLFLSRNPHALAFFTDSKLVHLSIKLKPIPSGTTPELKIICSGRENAFLKKLLASVATVQHSIRRLLLMPGLISLNVILTCAVFTNTQPVWHPT